MARPETDKEIVRRHGFRAFVEIAWEHVCADPIVYERHMIEIANHLEACMRGEIKDLVLNVPPGSSKSTICSILFPPYSWIPDPRLKFMNTSYDESLTALFAGTSLELVCSDWWKERWPHVAIVNETKANKTLYDTSAGGRRISTMMGGRATGKHAHILMVDDPHKPDDLEGDPDSVKNVLDEAWSRYINTFSKRRADPKNFRRICIMQRLHEEDLAGRILKRVPGVVHLSLPTEFEPENACKTKWGGDWRTEPGELLSKRFPREVIEQDRSEMTPRAFNAQHQQRPTPPDGSLFKREWFKSKWLYLPQQGLRYYLSIDANLKDRKDSDFCAIQVWATNDQASHFWLVDQKKGRWAFSDALANCRSMREKWPAIRNILIEDKANGTAIIDQLKQEFPGVIAVNPEGGKLARAESIEYLLRAGNCSFADAQFSEELEDEAASFPRGVNDDLVDAMSQFLVWITKKRGKRTNFKQAMANVRAGRSSGLI